MKKLSQGFLISLLIVFLLFSHSASARFLTSKQGHQSQKLSSEAAQADSWAELHDIMGRERERCEEEDEEECEKRRMMEEAHLDYVYTQHVRP